MADIDGMDSKDSTDKACNTGKTLSMNTFGGGRIIRARKPFLTSIAAQLTMSQAVQRGMTVEEIQGYLEGAFSTLLGMRKREMEELSVSRRDGGGISLFFPGFHPSFKDKLGKEGLEGEDFDASLSTPNSAFPAISPTISPADSIQEDKVICLECGKEFKQLTQKHLFLHGLSPKEYKQKHGMRLKTSLMAKSLSAARSEAAKARGVPENLKAFQEERRRKKVVEGGKVPMDGEAMGGDDGK